MLKDTFVGLVNIDEQIWQRNAYIYDINPDPCGS